LRGLLQEDSMKGSLECAAGTVALLVDVSVSVSVTAPAQTLGEKVSSVSAERLSGFVHNSSTLTANGVDSTKKTDSFRFARHALDALSPDRMTPLADIFGALSERCRWTPSDIRRDTSLSRCAR
jgi:hypothetical protein